MELEWSESARADLARIFEFNLQKSFAWAVRVDARLIERAYTLTRMPRLGRPHGEAGLFRLSVTDIQYIIDYEVAGDRIGILQILSTREVR